MLTNRGDSVKMMLFPKQKHKNRKEFEMELKINKLRGRMGELCTNLSELEKKTGISRHSLSLIFDEKRRARTETIEKICEALMIEKDRILYYFPYYFPIFVPEKATKQESEN